VVTDLSGQRIGFGRRLGAYVIDFVLVTIGLVLLVFVLSIFAVIALLSSGQDLADQNLNLGLSLSLYAIAFVLAWLYFAGLESSAWQATIGKRLLRLVVTDLSGQRIGFGRATGRYFGKLLIVIGGWFILFTGRKQALHDLMASTLVVRREHLALVATPPPQPQPLGHPGSSSREAQGA